MTVVELPTPLNAWHTWKRERDAYRAQLTAQVRALPVAEQFDMQLELSPLLVAWDKAHPQPAKPTARVTVRDIPTPPHMRGTNQSANE